MIVLSLSETNKFYFFRDDGTEIVCHINERGFIKSEKYRLNKEERKKIKEYFIATNIYSINERT